jgi:hypothetical protein
MEAHDHTPWSDAAVEADRRAVMEEAAIRQARETSGQGASTASERADWQSRESAIRERWERYQLWRVLEDSAQRIERNVAP